jgi:hypothetical protein
MQNLSLVLSGDRGLGLGVQRARFGATACYLPLQAIY